MHSAFATLTHQQSIAHCFPLPDLTKQPTPSPNKSWHMPNVGIIMCVRKKNLL